MKILIDQTPQSPNQFGVDHNSPFDLDIKIAFLPVNSKIDGENWKSHVNCTNPCSPPISTTNNSWCCTCK